MRAGARSHAPGPRLRRRFRSFSHPLGDGRASTVHVAAYDPAATRVSVAALEPPRSLAAWCREEGVGDAIVGGFFTRPDGRPLGHVWSGGRRIRSDPWDGPWGELRACVATGPTGVVLAPRRELPAMPHADLLQAGPMLLRGGRDLIAGGGDPEGFSAGSRQFDSDITLGRYPRAALGVADGSLLAVACDGRSEEDAGLTLAELSELMAALGATEAINLDGGGSTSLVIDGALRNRPREEHGIEIAAGRPVSTALVFSAA